MWIRKAVKKGDSVAITLPFEYAKHCGIKRGDHILCTVMDDDALRVSKIEPGDIFRLGENTDDSLPTIAI